MKNEREKRLILGTWKPTALGEQWRNEVVGILGKYGCVKPKIVGKSFEIPVEFGEGDYFTQIEVIFERGNELFLHKGRFTLGSPFVGTLVDLRGHCGLTYYKKLVTEDGVRWVRNEGGLGN